MLDRQEFQKSKDQQQQHYEVEWPEHRPTFAKNWEDNERRNGGGSQRSASPWAAEEEDDASMLLSSMLPAPLMPASTLSRTCCQVTRDLQNKEYIKYSNTQTHTYPGIKHVFSAIISPRAFNCACLRPRNLRGEGRSQRWVRRREIVGVSRGRLGVAHYGRDAQVVA
jgi:hypothetical protein